MTRTQCSPSAPLTPSEVPRGVRSLDPPEAWEHLTWRSLDFRFESFNFANKPQWNNPDTGVNSLNYGFISSARSMRTNQFALKFLF